MVFKMRFFLVGLIILLVGVVSFGVYNNFFREDAGSTISGRSVSPVVDINYGNFASLVSKNSMIRDLPKKSEVLISFYNFDKGYREVERSYLVRDGLLVETDIDSAEVSIFLNSRYLDEMNSHNFCSVLKKAYSNGDLGFESSLSSVKLLWKYKGMMKYKSCIF
jgi:hypothetical protein